MTKKKTEKLVNKYLEGKCTPIEKKLLEDFLQSYQNSDDFWITSEYGDKKILEDKLFDNIQNKIKIFNEPYSKRSISKNRSYLKYAAILILGVFCASATYLYHNHFSQETPVDSNVITLTLDNGEVKTINEDGSLQVTDANGDIIGEQQGKQLIYSDDSNTEELAYNTLTIPHGKLFDLKLSDGTHVFLNAGTTLRYPIKFINGMDRNVFLHGEAYFEVAKDKEHPFIVTVDDKMNVRALGTAFNISSYEEDIDINTVLIEGSVGIYDKEQEFNLSKATLLDPNYKASWDRTLNKIEIEEVETGIYTAWIDRKLIFRHAPFKAIKKKLERYYNVTIQNNNKVLDEITYNASFNNETIDQVLKTLSISTNIIYKIKDNTIIIE